MSGVCEKCHGAKTVAITKYTKDASGTTVESTSTVTCPMCRGSGGPLVTKSAGDHARPNAASTLMA